MAPRKRTAPDGAVHPVAALFPMLPPDELDALTLSVKTDGLREPIVLDGSGVLIDGRNRLEACTRAGVEPRFTTLDADTDPVRFILSRNVNRRHLSQGQRAMVTIVAHDIQQANPRGRPSNSNSIGITSLALAAEAGVSDEWVRQAIFVRQHTPHLVEKVLAGGSLLDAFGTATDTKLAIDNAKADAAAAEKRSESIGKEMERLQKAVQLLTEEIGPEVPIPPRPDLSVNIKRATTSTLASIPALDDKQLAYQHHVLSEIIAATNILERLVKEPIPAINWDAAGHIAGVRNGVSQLVSLAYRLAELHNATGSTETIRVVR